MTFVVRSLYHNNYYGKMITNISKGNILFTVKFTELVNLESDNNSTTISEKLAPTASLFCYLRPIVPANKVRVKSTITVAHDEEN